MEHTASQKGNQNDIAKSIEPSTSYPLLVPDPTALDDLEVEAKGIAATLDRLLEELKGSLNGMSELTMECAQTYNGTISSTCDTVDNTIKTMYQLIAKVEELSHGLRPLPRLAQQIKEIKRVLDLFEIHMAKSIG